MHVKRLLKAAIWFLAHPVHGLTRLGDVNFRRFAAGARPSASLRVVGRLVVSGPVYMGHRTRMNVPAGASLCLGSGVSLGDDCEIAALNDVRIGEGTSLQHRSILIGDVRLGAGCVLAPNLYISSYRHHFNDEPALPIREQDRRASEGDPAQRSRCVIVGDDCWLAINVVVTPGVTIGRGCVVGANSVVTRSLPPYSVAAGAPARVIRARYDFQPPPKIVGRDPGHIPYFYSGFVQWSGDDGGPDQGLSMGGGRWAGPHFSLALHALPDSRMLLETWSDTGGTLSHADTVVQIPAGSGRAAMVLAGKGDDECLEFSWSPTAAHGRLAIVSAECFNE